MRDRLLLLPTLLLAAACAARAPLAPPTAPFPLTEAWRVDLDPAVDGERLVGPIVTDGQALFLSLENGNVRGVEVATGQRRWETRLGPGALAAAPDRLILRQRDGTVVSLDPATGAARWTVATDARGDTAPTIQGQWVAVSGETLTLLDVTTGTRTWTTGGLGVFSTAPVFAGLRVLAGTRDGLLRCVDLAHGRALWTFDLGRPAAAPPVVDDRGRIFVGASAGRIIGLSALSGNPTWTWRVGAETPHAGLLLKDSVLFVSHSAVAHALVRANGHVAWRTALPSRPLAPPVRRGAILLALVYGDRENRSTLVALNEQGKRLGAFDINGEVVGAPLVLGDRLVVALREQSLVALAPAPPAADTKPTPESGAAPPAAPPSVPATAPPPPAAPDRP